ncbi:MAG: hypothetical protein LLF89_03430 [Spirochaetaceae bacterium]|nr:hypothetical protein [Spirochaetaceae bacterium]
MKKNPGNGSGGNADSSKKSCATVRESGIRRHSSLFVLLIFLSLLIATQAFGQDGSKPADAEAGKETITFTAKRMESIIAKGKEKTILIGSAIVNTGTIQVTADRIELFGKDYNEMLCLGNVTVKDDSKGFLLKAANVAYTRDTEVGIAQNQVQIDDSKNSLLLKAEWVQFDQKQSILVARIAVHILKEDFAVRAEYARYNRNDESLQVSGTPVALNSDGRLSADYMSGKADLNDLAMSGDVSGTITTTTTKKEEAAP